MKFLRLNRRADSLPRRCELYAPVGESTLTRPMAKQDVAAGFRQSGFKGEMGDCATFATPVTSSHEGNTTRDKLAGLLASRLPSLVAMAVGRVFSARKAGQ